jgi:tRNA(adenine34) deaminase
MRAAVEHARLGAARGGWPFGAAVIRADGVPIAIAHSTEISEKTVTAHAEMNAIRQAAELLLARELPGCTLYSTHECCLMCAGAILHAKIARVVIGTRRSDRPDLFRARRIALEDLLADSTHPPELVSGVLREEALALFDGIERANRRDR